MDIATVLGWIIGFTAIIGGQILEGGHVSSLIQPTAAMIVLGGTVGATFVAFPLPVILKAVKDARQTIIPHKEDPLELIKKLTEYAEKARKNGIISLESEIPEVHDPFLQRGLSMIVDGVDPQKFRDTMEVDLGTFEFHSKASAEYFEAAGGIAPTIGIIGAVLGLIHVMSNLSDASKLGAGIAVAFVATIYGLVIANLFCIPISSKLKHAVKEQVREKEMILEGLLCVLQGESPRLIEQKLYSYLQNPPKA